MHWQQHWQQLGPIVTVLKYVYGFIAFSTVVCYVHPRLRRPEARSIRQAVTSWWPSALLSGAAVMGGFWATLLLFVVLSGWTLHELLRMLPREHQDRTLTALAFAALPLHYGALLLGGDRLFFGVLLLYSFGVLPLVYAALRGPSALWSAVPRLQLGLMLTVLSLSHVPRLYLLPVRAPVGPAGVIALLLLCVMMGDATQYFFGKLLGRHPLAPVISPKKTWEGLLGGVLSSAATAAAAAPSLLGLSRPLGALIGASLCGLGLLGDLLVSALKRGAQIKDTGAVLPGQGGVLDRCDSLLLTAPLAYYLTALFL